MTPDAIRWGELAQEISRLITEDGDILNTLHQRVPSAELWQYKALFDASDDIFGVTLAALWAIEELGKLPPKVGDPWPPDGHEPADHLRIWAADPAGHKRPTWTVVSMAATAWCNALEAFVNGVLDLALDATALSRVRAAFPDANIDWTSEASARSTIVGRMRPSTKRKGKFLRYLEVATGCEIPKPVPIALSALLQYRNTVTHPTGGRTHQEHQAHPSSDQYVCWAGSVQLLSGRIIRALADRLDERRAAGETIPLFKRPLRKPSSGDAG